MRGWGRGAGWGGWTRWERRTSAASWSDVGPGAAAWRARCGASVVYFFGSRTARKGQPGPSLARTVIVDTVRARCLLHVRRGYSVFAAGAQTRAFTGPRFSRPPVLGSRPHRHNHRTVSCWGYGPDLFVHQRQHRCRTAPLLHARPRHRCAVSPRNEPRARASEPGTWT